MTLHSPTSSGAKGAPLERIWASKSGDEIDCRPATVLQDHPTLLELLRSFADQELDSIECTVLLGKFWYRAELTASPSKSGHVDTSILLRRVTPPYGLTPTELDVLTLLALGYTNVEIARRLGVAPRTVATHVEHVLTKLAVENRTAAASIAIQNAAMKAPLPGKAETQPRAAPNALERALMVVPPAAPAKYPKIGSRKSVLLGSIFPANNPDGTDALNGSKLAVEMINSEGGISGRFIEHVAIGADLASEDSIHDAIKFLAQQNVDGITFPYVENRLNIPRLMRLVSELDTPFLNSMTSSSVEQLVKAAPKQLGHVFQLNPSDRFYGLDFIRFVSDLKQAKVLESLDEGTGRVVVVTDDSEVPGLFDLWAGFASGRGLDFELLQCAETADWVSIAQFVAESRPDAVLVASFLPDSVRTFLSEFLKNPGSTIIYCIWAPGNRAFEEDLSSFDGIVWATTTGPYRDALGVRFSRAYRRRFGQDAFGSSASIQFDAVQLLRRAWTSSRSPYMLPGVNQALRDTVHRGVNGTYYLGRPSQSPIAFPSESLDGSISQAHLIYQVQQGISRIVYPRHLAESAFQPPHWMK